MAKITDSEQAKSIVNTLELFKEITIKVENVGNFRKYLTLKAQALSKRFITEQPVFGTLKVIRIK